MGEGKITTFQQATTPFKCQLVHDQLYHRSLGVEGPVSLPAFRISSQWMEMKLQVGSERRLGLGNSTWGYFSPRIGEKELSLSLISWGEIYTLCTEQETEAGRDQFGDENPTQYQYSYTREASCWNKMHVLS